MFKTVDFFLERKRGDCDTEAVMLSGLKTTDDPGLHTRLLHVSNAIRCAAPRRPRRFAVAEALAVVLVSLAVVGWIVATP